MNPWTIFWLTWGLVGGVAELIALWRKVPGDTLTEQVAMLRGSGWYSLLIFFLGWLLYHFLWETKR